MKPIFRTKTTFFILTMAMMPVLGWAKPVIVLDAAHGGGDTGIKARSQVGKDWNLRFAQALQSALENLGFEVVQVRKKDEAVSLEKRAQVINTAQASAVLVIDADGEWTGSRSGPMLVVEPPNQGAESGEVPRWGVVTLYQYRLSLKLARDIAQAVGIGDELSNLSDNRGMAGEANAATARLFCLPHQNLRYLIPPAVVLTPLFLSNASDIKKYSNDTEMANFAEKVAHGVANYLQY